MWMRYRAIVLLILALRWSLSTIDATSSRHRLAILDAPPPPESGGETAKTSGSETVQTPESGAEVAAGSEVADDAEVEEETGEDDDDENDDEVTEAPEDVMEEALDMLKNEEKVQGEKLEEGSTIEAKMNGETKALNSVLQLAIDSVQEAHEKILSGVELKRNNALLDHLGTLVSGVQGMRDHIDGFQTQLDDMNYEKAKTLLDHVHRLVKHFSNITDGVSSSEINATETYLNQIQNSTNAREQALQLEAKNRAELERKIEDLKANYTKMNNEDLLEFLKQTEYETRAHEAGKQNLIDGRILDRLLRMLL